MSQLAILRAHALRGEQAWIDTGLRYCLTAVCAGSAGVHAALIQPHFLESGLLGSAFTAATVAIAPFYGAAAGQKLSTLLHTHITLAVALLEDVKSGNTTAFARAPGRLFSLLR